MGGGTPFITTLQDPILSRASRLVTSRLAQIETLQQPHQRSAQSVGAVAIVTPQRLLPGRSVPGCSHGQQMQWPRPDPTGASRNARLVFVFNKWIDNLESQAGEREITAHRHRWAPRAISVPLAFALPASSRRF